MLVFFQGCTSAIFSIVESFFHLENSTGGRWRHVCCSFCRLHKSRSVQRLLRQRLTPVHCEDEQQVEENLWPNTQQQQQQGVHRLPALLLSHCSLYATLGTVLNGTVLGILTDKRFGLTVRSCSFFNLVNQEEECNVLWLFLHATYCITYYALLS